VSLQINAAAVHSALRAYSNSM